MARTKHSSVRRSNVVVGDAILLVSRHLEPMSQRAGAPRWSGSQVCESLAAPTLRWE